MRMGTRGASAAAGAAIRTRASCNVCFLSWGVLVAVATRPPGVDGLIPDLDITVARRDGSDRTTLGGMLSDDFGSTDVDKSVDFPWTIQTPPTSNVFLCPTWENNGTTPVWEDDETVPLTNPNVALWVPRGVCSFQSKAWVAETVFGAAAIVIYNSLTARYSVNYTLSNTSDVERIMSFPQPRKDYECENGQAWISSTRISVGNDSSTSLWADEADWNQECSQGSCASQHCLLTGEERQPEGGGDSEWRVCCAWDMPSYMARDEQIEESETSDIVAMFLTLHESSKVNVQEQPDLQIVDIDVKTSPIFNVSSIFLWLLGIFVTWSASYLSAAEYRAMRKNLLLLSNRMETTLPPPVAVTVVDPVEMPPTPPIQEHVHVPRDVDGVEEELGNPNGLVVAAAAAAEEDEEEENQAHRDGVDPSQVLMASSIRCMATTPAPLVPGQQEAPQPPIVERHVETTTRREGHRTVTTTTTTIVREETEEGPVTLELNAYHAIAFLVIGSTTLLLLYFFEIYNVVRVLYGLGCANATAQVILYPLFAFVLSHLGCLPWWKKPVCAGGSDRNDWLEWCGCRDVSILQWFSLVAAFLLAIVWLLVGFWNRPNPAEHSVFYWVMQDVFGAAICIAFIGVIRLNSIRVGALLLVAAFLYDIFFVFLTPLIFGDKDGDGEGDSVMVTVATSGGMPDDPEMCEKYPHEADCQRGSPLPMLFTIPRIGDYLGGHVLLGLGDIVLPGLLLSFAARYDAARRLVAFHRPEGMPASSTDPPSPHSHYLSWLTVAYAVGLMGALVAIILMNGRGQPALLYLVPSCLGTLWILSLVEHNGAELWKGPSVMKEADLVVAQQQAALRRRVVLEQSTPSTSVMERNGVPNYQSTNHTNHHQNGEEDAPVSVT